MPNPALKKLNWLLGAWTVSGEAHGQVTFNWMEGGFFMVHHIDMIGIKGIGFIGYNAEIKKLKYHYFDNNGQMLECTCEISEGQEIVFVGVQGVKEKFNGEFSNGGKTIDGKWVWLKDGKELSCRVNLRRIE